MRASTNIAPVGGDEPRPGRRARPWLAVLASGLLIGLVVLLATTSSTPDADRVARAITDVDIEADEHDAVALSDEPAFRPMLRRVDRTPEGVTVAAASAATATLTRAVRPSRSASPTAGGTRGNRAPGTRPGGGGGGGRGGRPPAGEVTTPTPQRPGPSPAGPAPVGPSPVPPPAPAQPSPSVPVVALPPAAVGPIDVGPVSLPPVAVGPVGARLAAISEGDHGPVVFTLDGDQLRARVDLDLSDRLAGAVAAP